MFTKKELEKALLDAGLRRDDNVVIHSSASSVGAVEGGIGGLLQVFCDFFGSGGLCVFPTMTYTLLHPWDPESDWCRSCPVPQKYCFAYGLARQDVRRFRADMPACTEALPNQALKTPGFRRSLSLTSSVAAFGRNADAFVSGHELCRSGCSKNSPWEKLLKMEGKILLLGVSVEEMTFLHGVLEWAFPETCRMPEIPFETELFDADGRKVECCETHRVANIARLTPHVEKALREKKVIKDFFFGNAPCMLLECRETFETVTELVKRNPAYL